MLRSATLTGQNRAIWKRIQPKRGLRQKAAASSTKSAPSRPGLFQCRKNAALNSSRGRHLPDAKSDKFVPLGGLDPSFARKRKQNAAPKPQKRLFAPTPGSTWHPEKARARAAMTEANIRAPLLLPFKATQPAKKQCRHCQRPRCRKAPWLYRHRSRWCRSRSRPQQACPS